MPDINFNLLVDRAKDVDPDIRFMALEDLRKFLSDETAVSTRSSLNYHLTNLFPTLLNMLDDSNPDVQNQAIRSFEPMVRYLNNNSILQLVKSLFTLVQASNTKNLLSSSSSSSKENRNFRSFTISIPNMALLSLFAQSNSRDKSDFVTDKLSKSNYKFDRELARSIMDYILPLILENETTFDNIELLINLITEIGYILNSKEAVKLARFFIFVSFTEQGIIGKKAIVGVERVVALINKEASISALVNDILSQGKNESRLANRKFVLYQLFSVILRRGIKPSQIADIYKIISAEIKADIEKDGEDFDFDVLEKQNAIKEEAFISLIDLVCGNFLPSEYKSEVFDIMKTFLKFDPLNCGESSDSDEDDDEDIVFSDDEIETAGEADNDGSWKLRAKATILTRCLLKAFPDTLELISSQILPILPFKDSNDQVVSEAVKTCIAIVQATSPRDAQNIQLLEKIVTDILQDAKEEQLPLFLRLIESLNRFDNASLIASTFAVLQHRQINSANSLDYLQFYTSVLKFHDNLSTKVVNHIASDIASNIDDKSLNMVSESLRCLAVLFKHKESNKISNIDQIVKSLVSKVENSKQYPCDLIRLAIVALGEVLFNNLSRSDGDIFNVFKSSIAYEGTNKATMDVLTEVYATRKLPEDYSVYILEKLEPYILSSNDSTSVSALVLTNEIALQIPPRKYDKIMTSLLSLLQVTNPTNYKYIFQIFEYWYEFLFQDETSASILLETIVKLVNEDKISVNEVSFFSLVRSACQLDETIYDHLYQSLNTDLPISAKILAVCANESKKQDLVNTKLSEFAQYSNSNINEPRLALVILFLTFADIDTPELNVNTLIELLRKKKFTNQANQQAVSTALGLLAKKRTDTTISPILSAYSNEESTQTRGCLIEALKVAVDACDSKQKLQIWKAIFGLQIEFTQDLIPELRKSGELLGAIALSINAREIERIVEGQPDNKSIYLILVVSKYLISNLEASKTNEKLLTYLIKASVEWLDVVDIDIRQIVVGNLLTGIHIKPLIMAPLLNQVILPKLIKQLTAEKAFKKVITMGPYKYVLDQGAEIRKLCYEFIYSVMAANGNALLKHNIDIQLLGRHIIEQGLLDEQPEVVVLACTNLANFFEHHYPEAKELIKTGNIELVRLLIEGLNKQLAKKLSAKASSQETENHQERIKSIIKLSKKIATVLDSMEPEFNENTQIFDAWNKYNSTVKQDFTVYYSSTNV
ncbi:TIP120 [Candida oxycetoniae]|uniref:TIP120 n=1 Tax=Candida oxycetoniae TaxID=497107 RepID=A0AAI9SUD0_9ASCO|nr:TIP120 [Candida oxycetoniae]KAI3402848.2 TIP120 [Candida oxycetoniae]